MILFPHLFISKPCLKQTAGSGTCQIFSDHGIQSKAGKRFLRQKDLTPGILLDFFKISRFSSSSSHRSHSREFAVDQSSLAFQTFTSSGSSQTFHGSPHLFSASIYGSGSNSSTLNTPGFFHCPVTTIMEPIIAGTPVV